jgi:hypothetical protein
MHKFEYCSSLDHAKWLVPDVSLGFQLSAEMLDSIGRYKLKQWIEQHCEGTVWMWNGCEMPSPGQETWGHLVSPSGVGIFFFEKEHDRVLFQLTWCYELLS